MAEIDYQADELANQLMVSLLNGENLDVTLDPLPDYNFNFDPDNPIFGAITKLDNGDLTEGTIDGNGTFDVLMRALNEHMKLQFEKNRITGAEYAKAYVEITAAAMGASVQFLLGRDQAFWAAANAQIAAANNLTELAIGKMKYQVAQVELKTGRAAYALTKLKLATEAKGVGLANEQIETQRAQTLDTRSDGTVIKGQIGKQKDLYGEQIKSYRRDAESKVMKIFSDAWITQKTIDEGLLAPEQFTNDKINEGLELLKKNVNLTTSTWVDEP